MSKTVQRGIMCRYNGNCIIKVLKSIIFMLLILFLVNIFSNKNNVYAINNDNDSIIISLETETTEVDAGNEISIDVVANNIPDIVSWEAIEFHYDSSKMNFVSMTKGSKLPDTFAIDFTTNKDDIITISGSDEEILYYTRRYFSSQTSDLRSMLKKDDLELFSSDEKVILGTLKFKIKDDAQGNIRIFLNNFKAFLNVDSEFVTAYSRDGINLNVNNPMEDNANLASLELGKYELIPSFNANIYEYEATVDMSVNDLTVIAETQNSASTLKISGNRNLEEGKNTVYVEVTSEDGMVHNKYTIVVDKNPDFLGNRFNLFSLEGDKYTIVQIPDSIKPPEGFIEVKRMINGNSVPVFENDGIESVLVYLIGENMDEAKLYYYNPSSRVVTEYNKNIYLKKSKVLIPREVSAMSIVPSGFMSATRVIKGVETHGYANRKGEFICYFADERGEARFYKYDEKLEDFVDYKNVFKDFEKEFRFLFVVFVIIAIAEALFIIIFVVTITKINKLRAVPRAKRV